jgi:hypothetical protein
VIMVVVVMMNTPFLGGVSLVIFRSLENSTACKALNGGEEGHDCRAEQYGLGFRVY